MNYWRGFKNRYKRNYRIVRRDFLGGISIFFIQKRIFFWWVDMDTLTGTLNYSTYNYENLISAAKELKEISSAVKNEVVY